MAALTALTVGLGASGLGLSGTSAYGAPLWSQLDPSPSSSAPRSDRSSTVITYAEDAPCDPTPVAAATDPKVVQPRRLHRVRRRIVRKVVAHRPAPVVPKPVAVVHRPIVHRAVLHRAVASVHRRRRHLARAAQAAAPKRCVTLHSERLTSAGLVFGDAPVAALDGPPALVFPDTTPDFGLGGGDSGGGDGGDSGYGGGGGGGGGGAAFPNPVMGGGGGGGVTTGPGGSGSGSGSGPVSAAPEPQTWMLMILGVGLCGAVLRRNRRTAAAA